MSKYLTEFLGTFFLVALIGLSVGSGSSLFPLAIGFGLTALVYMGYHISGAHYNPAVTLSILILGKITWQDSLIYLLAQLLGSALGALAAGIMIQDQDYTFILEAAGSADIFQILLAEILFTFLLMMVVLNVAVSERTKGNSFYGIAVGLIITAGIYAVSEISGAVFNPAVGFGPNLINMNFLPMWYYTVGPMVGSLLATFLFIYTEKAAGTPVKGSKKKSKKQKENKDQ
ncbi:MAG: aquaporin [Bacteroidia bacterium]|nr:aquaporin [Bacteroidia bacterium]